MMQNITKRLLSAVLILALLIQLLPIQCFAVESEAAGSVKETEETGGAEQTAASIVGEINELRTEEAKHFRLSDGSNIAVSYGVPVHYRDEKGSWQDIDNQPLMAADGDGTIEYQISNGGTAFYFAGTLEEGSIFSASCSEGAVSVSMLDTTQAVDENTNRSANTGTRNYDRDAAAELAPKAESSAASSADEEWTAEDLVPEKLETTIVYQDVFPNVDMRYTVYSYHVKEEIVVNSLQDFYSYDFLLTLDKLTAHLNEDGSVSLLATDDKTLVYSIPAPCMTDAAGISSNAVSYQLTPADGGVILTVTADKSWINSSERKLPVLIDPTLKLELSGSYETDDYEIYSRFVREAFPDAANNTGGLYVGYSQGSQYMEAFLHINSLPSVPEGSAIVGAWLQLHRYVGSYIGKTEMSIGLYPVTEEKPSNLTALDWMKSLSWNTKPAYDKTNVIDFVHWNQSSQNGPVAWNVTELAKQWYTGSGNRTLALVPMETHSYSSCGWQYFASTGTSSGPVLIVAYRSCEGIEPYYTYRTLSVGAAGTAYIADATGQLKTAKSLVSYASSVNPVSVSLVYNSDKFAANSTSSYSPLNAMGLNMFLGYGWTLDCIQWVNDKQISGTPYKQYIDGDGTEHYFAQDTTKDPSGVWFYDEDGLGLKIKKTADGAYTMSDDNGNAWYFTNHLLTSTSDADGNKVYINYNSNGRLNTVTQINDGCAEVVVARFAYDASNNLTGVTDAAGVVYHMVYDDNRLFEIRQGETTIARYVYMGNRLRKLTDVESNYSIHFDFDEAGRVSLYQELVRANNVDTVGATVGVTYPHPCKTIYRDYGADRKSDSDSTMADDILTHYLFDDACRTVNAYTTTNGTRLLGASNAAYAGSGGTDKRNNHTSQTASIGAAAQQLIRNTGFESTASGLAWTFSGSDISVSTENPRTGTKSLKGLLSADGTQNAKRMTSALTEGWTYTFSAWVSTTAVEHFSGEGIYLKVTDTSGNTWTSEPVDYATPTTVDSGWTRISVTFKAQNSVSHTLTIVNDGVYGEPFYADDIQLERADAPSNCNLVDNGGMQLGSVAWTMGSGCSIVDNVGHTSTASLKIYGAPTDESAYAYQDIPINLPSSQSYVLSGWGKANAVPDTVNEAEDPAADTYKQFGLRAVIYYANGQTEYHYAPFNPDFGYWQFTSLIIVPKKPAQTVEKIRIYCTYQRNANVAWFDNISLLREVAQTMDYDDEGNLKSVTTTGLTPDANSFDDNNNLIKTVTGGNGTYSYSYDNTDNVHQLTAVKLLNDSEATVLKQAMTYDAVGNVTGSTLSGTGRYTMTTSASYTGNGNRLLTVTDATGATITYGYGGEINKMWALPSSVSQPLSDTQTLYTHMEYDSFGRTTKTSIASTAKLEYIYSKGTLSSLRRTDDARNIAQTYNFTSDLFGNMTAVKVGTVTLASYEYAAGNGLLKKQTYANGDTVSYTYDVLGRTKTVTYTHNGVTTPSRVLSYSYNGDGQLSNVTETANGQTATYFYGYDTIGRLISMRKKVDGDTVLLMGSRYNSRNQLIRNSWRVGAAVFSQDYTYNSLDGSINTVTMPDGKVLTMGYNSLRQLSTITGGVTAKRYLYRVLDGNRATNQVTSLSYTELGKTFQYTYDIRGNIATHAAPGKATVTYTYDKQGQLLSATGGSGYQYSYTYDNVGNILTATKNGTTHTYTYSTYDWKDKLIAYDNQPIAYDASGNPTSYYNGTRWAMTWVNGRELATASSGNTNLSFAYDGNGIRTSKTVNGVEHRYYYSGGKLLRETYGSNILDFAYNADGSLYSFRVNGTYYYYVTNLQGDVIGIIDANGNTVASYEYDPYGDVISATGTLAATNPMRYRGYYYDAETGLYYCQSRYYDPEICRFINADAYASTGQGLLGNNMFAYCGNNPVNYKDSSGLSFLPCVSYFDGEGGGYPIWTNLADTPEEQTRGMINGQGRLPYSSNSIGLGSYGYSGCPYIAVYNAMQLTGNARSLHSITQDFLYKHGVVLFGALGAGPWSIESYIKSQEINYTSSYSVSDLTANISEGSVIIFTVWNDRSDITSGWHAMTALYAKGQYWVFNQYNNSTTYAAFPSLGDAFAEGMWLHGIRID